MADATYPKIIPGETGPNGHPVGYDDNRNLVEWTPADQPGHEGEVWPLIMRRNDEAISAEYKKLWDKVWWNRHMSRHQPELECKDEPLIGCDAARALIDRYGREFLEPGDDVEWGITLGKFMALDWVLGTEWDEVGDT